MSRKETQTRAAWRLMGLLLAVCGVVLLSGCSRCFWRQQANCEATQILREKTCDPRWALTDYRFEAKPESRFYLPYNKDAQPMPTDDPSSNWLMRCVYGMKGSDRWTQNGVISSVENPQWLQSLPKNENGQVVLNRANAMQIALTNSPEYQTALENLYLSALDVSLQRFAFDTHFGLAMGADYQNSLHGDSSLRYATATASASRNLATGGQIITEIANSIVWNFGGSDSSGLSTTLLNMSLFQPLLRGAGRAVALESLTQSERSLLANVRRMERYRQGFYINTIAADFTVEMPGSGNGGMPSAGSSPNAAGSLYGLIYTQLDLANQRQYVADLHDSMERMEAYYQADRIGRTQVDQTRQSLLNAQMSMLESENSYQNTLDSYKVKLGLPPGLEVVVEDPMLESFVLISPVITQMRNEIKDLQESLREGKAHAEVLHSLKSYGQQAIDYCRHIDADMLHLKDVYPKRLASLRELSERPVFVAGRVDRTAADPEVFVDRVKHIGSDYIAFKKELGRLLAELDAEKADDSSSEQEERIDLWMDHFNSQLMEMSLLQARVRLDSIMLVPTEVDELHALQLARENRLDWMNARAALVDQWRQIEIRANALKSDLDVSMNGRVDLEGSKVQDSFSLGIALDTPTVRKSERNAYVTALINYDRSRRAFIQYEDGIHKNIRTLMRQVRLAQLNFELRRIGVLLAMSRVEQANLQLLQPPKPNQTSQFGDSFARDLTDALRDMLSNQNTFIREWINFEACRMGVEITTGTFRLDSQGNWIDSAASALRQ